MLQQGLRASKRRALRTLMLSSLIAGVAACDGGNIIKGNRSSSSDAISSQSSAPVSSSSVYMSTSAPTVSSSVVSSSSVAFSSTASSAGDITLHPDIQTSGNPFTGAHFYVSPDISTLMDGSIAKLDPSSELAQKMETVKHYPSAVWLDRIEAIYGGGDNGGRRSLEGHFEEAKAQQLAKVENGVLPPMTAVIIVYNLPDRDCAAAASNGTLHSDEDGMRIYQEEYIDVIANTFAQYPNIRIVAMLEPDSYPNMLTNLGVPACASVNDKKVYERGIQYAISKFADMPNVYTYIDIAHSGWLGWEENREKAVTGFTNLVKGATPSGKLDVIRGFASNTSNYTPLEEPNVDPTDNSVVSGSFYQWNRMVDENSYIDALHAEFTAAGFDDSLGFIIDTARNGWGGPDRSTTGRIDRRTNRGHWCNVNNAGIGEPPKADPDPARPHIDAYFWMKPPGESDGIADPNATDANEEGKSFDPNCGPNNADAMPGAPHAGHWFHEQFVMLVENAHPPIPLTPVMPPVDEDSDADGVVDSLDQCPATAAGAVVNADGCSDAQLFVDTDNDGVEDGNDACPATAAGADVDANGCSAEQLVVDNDNDGVDDNTADQCLDTPAGESVDANGCAASQLDDDSDQVNNAADQCPETPAGSTVNDNGCAESQLDDDNDQVTNDADQCPGTPADSTVNDAGCAPSQLDDDNDQVTNDADQCADTPAGETADNNGCSSSQKDSDNDGVTDNLDMCEGTTAGATVDSNGCSDDQNFVDTDNDGVEDGSDSCPNTPAGATVNDSGCAASERDSDNDGINDDADQCPATTAGAAVDSEGCSDAQKDSDNDTVNDAADLCPATPAGETANAEGCSASQRDSDSDGVNDDADQCANTPTNEAADGTGCSPSQTDSDGDTVTDEVDQCPNTPAGETANNQGCAPSQLDSDNDGVMDNVDACANTPSSETADSTGCSPSQTDSDGDTITDDADQCPNTPNGETANSQGCSASQLDSDNDGVNDNLDKCANTPNGETADSTGCSASQSDSDGDTITDNLDVCPNTPAGEAANSQGCSASQRDSDNDGVNDNADMCADTPAGAAVNGVGCSASQTDSDGDRVTDDADLCPATAAGSMVDSNGCAANQRDGDNDGVTDDIDACANTPAGASTNTQGCADSQLDSDNDGVTNDLDQCPATAANASVNAEGCSAAQRDSDGDGVNDAADQCPDTNPGASANSDGCAAHQLDADNDGVSDADDQCPDTVAGESVDAAGCGPTLSQAEIDSRVAAGRDLYEGANGNICSACHGAEGTATNFDQITDSLRNYDELVSLIESGSGAMPACAPTDNCATQLTDFIWVEFLNGTLTRDGGERDIRTEPTQAEIEARVAAGKALYEGGSSNICSACHGADGTNAGFDQITDSTKTYDEIVSLVANGSGAMPACQPANNCATQLTDYIWVEFLGGTLTLTGGERDIPTPPSQAEIDARVAAGKTLYEGGSGNICSACHGADGTNAGFDQITDSTKTYDEIVSLVANGSGAMPACQPANDCATQLTDYIWVQFLGGTLTSDGGERPVSSGPTQAEIDARVAAGRALYTDSNGDGCSGCHGATGSEGPFNNLTTTQLDYASIVSVLEAGSPPLMPSCSGADCASQLADFIWVEFVGGTLTENGGQ